MNKITSLTITGGFARHQTTSYQQKMIVSIEILVIIRTNILQKQGRVGTRRIHHFDNHIFFCSLFPVSVTGPVILIAPCAIF